MTTIFDDFTIHPSTYWTQTRLGTGQIQTRDSILRLHLPATRAGIYADAQIDDYGNLPRSRFPWQPPLQMIVQARSSLAPGNGDDQHATNRPGELRGTAGFGFWNYPFSVRGDVLMLPEAIWFFYAAPPSNMALVPDLPGWGWKAQVIHAMRKESLLAAIPTALAIGRGRITGKATHTRSAARWLQRASGAQESVLSEALLTSWHTYQITWMHDQAIFQVDNEVILIAQHPPTRPLGFVAWIDNQYAIATPQGQLRFGVTPVEEEWLDIDTITIKSLTGA